MLMLSFHSLTRSRSLLLVALRGATLASPLAWSFSLRLGISPLISLPWLPLVSLSLFSLRQRPGHELTYTKVPDSYSPDKPQKQSEQETEKGDCVRFTEGSIDSHVVRNLGVGSFVGVEETEGLHVKGSGICNSGDREKEKTSKEAVHVGTGFYLGELLSCACAEKFLLGAPVNLSRFCDSLHVLDSR